MGVMKKIKNIWNSIFVPTSIKPIRFVMLFENILSLYRNLNFYKKSCRTVIHFRIVGEIILTISFVVYYSIYILPTSISTSDYIFFYTNAITSIVIIFLACYYSTAFKKLLSLIESNDMYIANDEKYQKNMRRQDRIIKYGLLACNLIVIFAGNLKYAGGVTNDDPPITVSQVMFVLNSKICNCRCLYEYIALYAVLYVISEQVECITRAVSKKHIRPVRRQWDSLSDEDSCEIKLEPREFDELSTVFSNIKECSKLCNKIYGLQLIFMLGSATVYCIMFLYALAFISVKGHHDVNSLISNVLKLFMFCMLLLLLSLGAQKKQNNVKKLRRQLGKLLINFINDDAHYKATKDFLRLVSMRSIKTETLGSINVDMSLIPSFTMFITSYTVIALQFNNIV